MTLTFREFCESPSYCNLELSPLVAALADASEGIRPTSIGDEVCLLHFGCVLDGMPKRQLRTGAVRTGGRAGKTSRIGAPQILYRAWTTDAPASLGGEVLSAIICAPDMKLARQAYSFVVGYVGGSPILKRALVGEPTKDSLELRRPDGKIVRIECLAASRGGRAVRGRSILCALLDESAYFFDETSGVVNDAEIFRAIAQRVVPGGQVWIISTPWVKGAGLLERAIERDWGKHEHVLCAVGGTRAWNPGWDPDHTIETDLRDQDPEAARREIDGLPSSTSALGFFEPSLIERCVDKSLTLPRKPLPHEEVSAGVDLGFRSDSSALCIVHRDHQYYRVGDLLELRPTADEPLKPSEVCRAFAERLGQHHLSRVVADQHYRESIREYMNDADISIKDAPAGADGVASTYQKVKQLMREGKILIPNHPRLIQQLRSVEWRPNAGGSISILLPRERLGGHCDIISAWVLSIWEACGTPVPEAPIVPGSSDYYKQLDALAESSALAAFERRGADAAAPWWQGDLAQYGYAA